MQMKFGHKSNLLSCLILSRTLTYCNSFNARRAPINPKEIAEKYEKSKSMQILVVKTEIHNNNKTNGIGGSSMYEMHSSCFSELAGCEVSHGCFQHHHHC